MNRRGFLGASAAAFCTIMMQNVVAQSARINDAINQSGRQRMLSQRMAKCYLQLGQQIDAARSQKILAASIALFDRQLAELKTFAPTPANRATLQEQENAWIAYRDLLTAGPPNQRDARSVLAISEEVLALAHKATLQLEQFAGTSAGKLVNIAGRERMLSQRMAKFYQAINWNVAPPQAATALNAARGEFVAGLATLSAAPNNTAEIRRGLELAGQQWIFFDNALRNPVGLTAGPQQATNVATTSERILEVMDGITAQYAAA